MKKNLFYSILLTFPILGFGQSFPEPYCSPTGLSFVESISRVIFADIDQSSIPTIEESQAPLHEDFTSVVGHVQPGQTYPIALEGHTGGPYISSFTVFIDWNQDGSFNNTDERFEIGTIEDSEGTDGQQATGEILVPTDALLGNTRMRIVKRDGGYQPPVIYATNACNIGSFSFGQVEDYTLNIGEDTQPEGCLTVSNPNSPAFPTDIITPDCFGVPESLTGGQAFTGEYTQINVTAGTEYRFSSSVSTHFITIGNANGTEVLAAGITPVVWTADSDQIIRFYTHLDADCNASQQSHDRIIQCGEVPPAPTNDDCEDVTPTVLTNGVPVTFTGTTIGATASPEEMDSLELLGAVWEVVTLTGECNNLTIDYCGTPLEIMGTAFTYLSATCPVAQTIDGTFDNTSCSDGNLTIRFANLPAGTYYIPVAVAPQYNTLGEYTMNVISEDCPQAPQACEDYFVPSNDFQDGLLFGGPQEERLATDIPVGENNMMVYGIEPTIVGEATEFNFIIHSDFQGKPGVELETRTGTIASQQVVGQENIGGEEYEFIKYAVTFDTPMLFEANTTYWIEIITDAFAWESTFALNATLGNGDVYNSLGTLGEWRTDGDQFVFNLICEDLSIGDLNSFYFTYHPNPVKDVLNISSDKVIENVSAFNLAGQKVLNNAKVSNGQIDVNALSTGTYVFRVTLQGGQVETFKIVKK